MSADRLSIHTAGFSMTGIQYPYLSRNAAYYLNLWNNRSQCLIISYNTYIRDAQDTDRIRIPNDKLGVLTGH